MAETAPPPNTALQILSVHTEPSSPALRKPRVHVRTPTSDREQGPETKPEKCSFYHLVENKVRCQEDMCHLSHQANPGRLLRRGRRLRGRLWGGAGRAGALTKTGGSVLFYPESWPGLAVCQGTESENGKWMGEVRRGTRGVADPPSSLPGVWEDGQALQTSSLPRRKSPLCVCGLPHRLQDPTCSPSQIGTQREQLANSPTRGWDQGPGGEGG